MAADLPAAAFHRLMTRQIANGCLNQNTLAKSTPATSGAMGDIFKIPL